MAARIQYLDFDALQREGYAILPGLVQRHELARFERDIAAVGKTLALRKGLEFDGKEPLTAVLQEAGPHRAMIFDHVKRLFVLEALAAEISKALEAAGFFRRARLEVPMAWATLRADLPGEETYTFPLHQDYATTRCRRAWRVWVPLRSADAHHGTIELAPRSHVQGPYRYVTEATRDPYIERGEVVSRGLELKTFAVPAGDGIIFDPLLVHGSVANRSQRAKYVMLLHLQDLSTLVDPDDPGDPLQPFLMLTNLHRERRSR